MSRFRLLPLALAAAVFGQPVLAGDPPATTAPAPAEPAAEDKLICKTLSVTGSRVSSKKVCMTKREWDAHRELAQDRTRRAQKIQGATNGS